MREHKVVVLGSGGVGKSAVTIQYVYSTFEERYDPTIEDSYHKTIDIDGSTRMLEILDTAGTEQFKVMRDLYIETGQGFVLMYSVTCPRLFSEIKGLHEQLIRVKGYDKIPIVLVGNKCDLNQERAVTKKQGLSLAEKIGGVTFFETSACSRTNIEEIFADLARQIHNRYTVTFPGKKRRKCNIL